MSFAVIVLARPVVALFGGGGEIMGLTVRGLRIFALGLPFIGLKMFYTYYFQSSRNRRLSMLSSVIGECAYLVAVSVVLGTLFGTAGLFAAYPVSELLYLITILAIAWKKCGHFPKTADEWLLLPPDFDVAEENRLDMVFRSREDVPVYSAAAYDFCAAHRIPPKQTYAVSLSVEELSRNIFEHGMKKGRAKYVDVKVIVEEKDITVRFRDSCPRFDPVERARILDDADKTKCIGLRMIFSLVKDIRYVHVINLNTLLIRIDRAGPEESGDGA